MRNAGRSLQAEHLKPALASVEKKAGARCYFKIPELVALTAHFKALPEYRGRVESLPGWSLVTLMLVAMLCDAPRGQKNLATLARRLTQQQRRALGIRPNSQGFFPAPSQSTFSRLRARLKAPRLNQTLLAIQTQVRGQPPPKTLLNPSCIRAARFPRSYFPVCQSPGPQVNTPWRWTPSMFMLPPR